MGSFLRTRNLSVKNMQAQFSDEISEPFGLNAERDASAALEFDEWVLHKVGRYQEVRPLFKAGPRDIVFAVLRGRVEKYLCECFVSDERKPLDPARIFDENSGFLNVDLGPGIGKPNTFAE